MNENHEMVPSACTNGRRRTAARHRPTTTVRGLTLLEVMLSLALMAMVLVLIGTAIDLHLRMLDQRRAEVEQSQLARTILRRIADDLRGAVYPSSSDFSGAESLAGDAAAGASQSDLDALGQAAADLGMDDPATMGASQDIATNALPAAKPGLYGNQYELQVDVSRLPRVDEFQRLLSSDSVFSIRDFPSDVKTIAYYVRAPNSSGMTAGGRTSPDQFQSGLVRRVLDRAATLYATENGNASSLEKLSKVIAPEVTALEFQYFDGTQWLTQWDSSELGGLPVAVRITMSIASRQTSQSGLSTSVLSLSGGTDQVPSGEIVSLVVRLPTAKPAECNQQDAAGSDGLEAVGL